MDGTGISAGLVAFLVTPDNTPAAQAQVSALVINVIGTHVPWYHSTVLGFIRYAQRAANVGKDPVL